MNSAAGGYFDSMRKTSQQTLTDLASAPVWFLASGRHDRGLYLLGQLVCIAERSACPIAESFQAAFLIAFEDLVASLPGNAELAAQGSHAFPVLESDHKAHSFVHHRSFLPWHPHFRPLRGQKCNPCLRNVLLPMSRDGQSAGSTSDCMAVSSSKFRWATAGAIQPGSGEPRARSHDTARTLTRSRLGTRRKRAGRVPRLFGAPHLQDRKIGHAMPEPSPFHRFVWIECAPFDKLAASRSELRVRVEAVAADQ